MMIQSTRPNAPAPLSTPASSPGPANVLATEVAGPDGFLGAEGPSFSALRGETVRAPVLSAGNLGFETIDSASTSHVVAATASAVPPYDPAGNLFPGLNWLDPATYHPADDSKLPAQQQSEIDLVKNAQDSRTPQQTAIALDLAQRGTLSMWMDYADRYAQKAGPFAGAILKAKLALALGTDGIDVAVQKQQINEPRPYQVDPSIQHLGGDPGGSSSPSGHSASAYAAASVLAEADPAHAQEYFQAAANVARSRVYLGVHFPGDVAAGARLGEEFGKVF